VADQWENDAIEADSLWPPTRSRRTGSWEEGPPTRPRSSGDKRCDDSNNRCGKRCSRREDVPKLSMVKKKIYLIIIHPQFLISSTISRINLESKSLVQRQKTIVLLGSSTRVLNAFTSHLWMTLGGTVNNYSEWFSMMLQKVQRHMHFSNTLLSCER